MEKSICKISIVMATYNGEQYIEEQLESILAQTVQPDEVLICDDCSSDNTVAIIKDFIKKNELLNWKIECNLNNQGWKKNFYNLLCKASGDIIFMSDQDDIWMKEKIEVMCNAILKKKEILCLVGNYVEIDGQGNQVTKEIEQEDIFYAKKISYTSNFYRNVYLGCTMCIKKELRENYKQLEGDFASHDAICAQIALLKDGLYYLPYITIKHRLHGKNTTCSKSGNNAGNSSLDARMAGFIQDVKYFSKLLKQSFVTDKVKKDIEKYVRCQQIRYDFCTTKNLLYFVKELKFVPYVVPFSKWFGDFAYTFGVYKQLGKISRCIKK